MTKGNAVRLLSLFLLILIYVPLLSNAASVSCGTIAGTRLSTASDAVVKNGTLKEGVCYNPSEYGISENEEKAKQFLKSLPKQFAGSSSYDCKTYEDKNIDKLSGKFAVCMERFLRDYATQVGKVTITSAYRSPEEQTCVCKGETGLCGRSIPLDAAGKPIGGIGVGHQYGTAMDIRAGGGTNTEYARMHEFARKYGVHFRLGMADRPHVEPATQECGLGTSSPPPGYSSTQTANNRPQGGGMADSLRSILGMQQGQQQQGGQPSVPGQSLPQAQNPLSAFQQGASGFSPTQSPTNQGGGFSGSASPVSSSGAVQLPTYSAPPRSISDILTSLINPTPAAPATGAAPAQSSTTIKIHVNPKDIASSNTRGAATGTTTAIITAGYAYAPNSVSAPQTFTSRDLSQVSPSQSAATRQTILARLKSILESMLVYLRSLSGR